MLNGEVLKFKYPEVVSDHYRYRWAVENQNEHSNDGVTKYQICLYSSQITTWWNIQVFVFFTACTEVNAYLQTKHFLKKDDTFMNFCKKMSKLLIGN